MTKQISLGTPEGKLDLHPDAAKEPSLDALDVILDRLQTKPIVKLLEMDGMELNEGFNSGHDHVMNATNCLDGLIDQER